MRIKGSLRVEFGTDEETGEAVVTVRLEGDDDATVAGWGPIPVRAGHTLTVAPAWISTRDTMVSVMRPPGTDTLDPPRGPAYLIV
jgi:hypothetical protein